VRIECGLDARQPNLVIAAGRAQYPVGLHAKRRDRNTHGMVDRCLNPGLDQLARRHGGLWVPRAVMDAGGGNTNDGLGHTGS
jgi:hypothetical protein